eukprot:TRINITY_DN14943_c0_g1_i1.p1 TRINITY_DN14943_c0_g1~~TRINITY_DN14943_c0_g1_i1.p1  ORF type:complete len:545 (-),score=102.24 TRINITY_DN14943_c0_g1_i1:61-1602(-)
MDDCDVDVGRSAGATDGAESAGRSGGARVAGDSSVVASSKALATGRRVMSYQVSQALLEHVRRQIEWYFSDANLATDHCMYEWLRDAPGGWLTCGSLLRCRRLAELHVTPPVILDSLRGSHLQTKVFAPAPGSEDLEARLCVRRRQPLPPLLRREARGCNGELPADPESQLVSDVFGTMNRLKDQCRVQDKLGLREVGDEQTVFLERRPEGAWGRSGGAVVLAVGYERVLYGDDGPYIEVRYDQVRFEGWPFFFNKTSYSKSYFDEYYTFRSYALWQERWNSWCAEPSRGILRLYAQRHAVDDRPWAPGAGNKPHEYRRGGYADYRPGYLYFSASEALITADHGSGQGLSPLQLPVAEGVVVLPPTAADEQEEEKSSVADATGVAPADAGEEEPSSGQVEKLREPNLLRLLRGLIADVRKPAPASQSSTSTTASSSQRGSGSGAPATSEEAETTAERTSSSGGSSDDSSAAPPPPPPVCPPAECEPKAVDPRTCWEFQRGGCRRGIRCKWLHA